MKNIVRQQLFVLLGIFAFVGSTVAQTSETITHTDNSSCASAKDVCSNLNQKFDFRNEEDCSILPLYYVITFDAAISSAFTLNLAGGGTYNWYGPFDEYSLDACEQIQNYTANTVSGSIPSTGVWFDSQPGTYILKVVPTNCAGSVSVKPRRAENFVCNDEPLCDECVTSFSPKPGKYVVSAWVKEDGAGPFVTNYEKATIKLTFHGINGGLELFASGAIIDGWQRIEQEIEIPVGATGMDLELRVTSGDAYFDDIRFFPFDGSMMSYVYDPQSLRLMAELDERNYATLYEYDEEGKLIRVKKETEKGVMTIQENGDNIQK